MTLLSTREKCFLFILGLSTFLAMVGFSVSFWSISSLKYQFENSSHLLQNKIMSIQESSKIQNSIYEENVSQLNLTVERQNRYFKEVISKVNSAVQTLKS